MIVTRTPYRISFFGGGTDYPAWYREHGGAVLATTIDKYCHVLLRAMPPFLGSKYRVFWSKMEAPDSVAAIEHPGVRGCLQYLEIDEPLEINHAGDLPARAGLGSSSAFTVGMLHALHALKARYVSKARLAAEAVDVEQNVLKETVGIQDQIECAHGGLNLIEIRNDGSYDARPVMLSPMRVAALQARLILVWTGVQRFASDIARAQIENADRRTAELRAIQALVPRAHDVLGGADSLDEFGRLLHETWMLKRTLSDKVTNPEIDALYGRCRDAGALGGKILGAGGGGFLLLYVRPQDWTPVAEALGGTIAVPVRFERSGTQVAMYEP